MWTWNTSYQALYNKTKLLMKNDICMKFCIMDDETTPLYLETDASRIELNAALLQTRGGMTCPKDTAQDTILRPIAFGCKSLTSAEHRYSNIKRRHWAYCMVLKNFTIIALIIYDYNQS